eukprot:6065575-Pyramimonas_sp.AAC.1
MLDKCSALDYEPLVIAWTEGVEEVDGWVDAWQEAGEATLQDAPTGALEGTAANALVVQTPHDRARARAERMERVATLRIAPEPANEEAAAERA